MSVGKTRSSAFGRVVMALGGWLFLASLVVRGQDVSALLELSERQTFSDKPLRHWTSSDGKHSVRARLIAAEGPKLLLELDDGKRVSIQFSELSLEDQSYVAQSRTPDILEIMGLGMDRGAAEEGSGDSDPAQSRASLTQLREIGLQAKAPLDLSAQRWQLPDSVAIKSFSVRSYSFQASAARISSTADDKICAISIQDPFGGGDSDHPKSWVTIVDLPSGETMAEIALPTEHSIVDDIHGNGSLLAVFDEVGSPSGSQIQVFQLQQDQLHLVHAWNPAGATSVFRNPQGLRFLANGDLLMDVMDRLVVWQLQPLAAKYWLPKNQDRWQLAPDRVHCLVETDARLFEVDLVRGVCTGECRRDPQGAKVKSLDGTRQAGFENQVVTIETVDGTTRDSFYVPNLWPDVKVFWIDDRFLQLKYGRGWMIVDSLHRVALASVQFPGSIRADGWISNSESQDGMHRLEITRPNANMRGRLDWAGLADRLPLQGDQLLVLHPGDRVRLEVNLTSDPSEKAEATNALRALLAARGVVENSGAAQVLSARSTIETETVPYRAFHAPPWSAAEKVTVRTTVNQLTLTEGDEILWTRSSRSGPGSVLVLQEGETAQQAANRAVSTGQRFWLSLQIPQHVARHPQNRPWFQLQDVQGVLQEVR